MGMNDGLAVDNDILLREILKTLEEEESHDELRT